MNNIGLLIFNAARIFFPDESQANTLVSLLHHLDCPLLRKPIVWEHYFILRIDRKILEVNQFGKEAI
jgi:hypothetical protein